MQVKSGGVNVSQVRDLKGVLEREQAQLGLFVTLRPPSGPMLREALSAGFYVPDSFPNHQFPRLQILTVEELLSGSEAQYPHFAPDATFRRAPRLQQSDGDQMKMV